MFIRDTFTWGKCHFTIENVTQYNRNVNLPQVNVSCINMALVCTIFCLYMRLINGARLELHGQGYLETRLGRPLLWHFCTSHSEVAADQPRKHQEYHPRRVQQVSWSWQPLHSSWNLPSLVSKYSCPNGCHLWVACIAFFFPFLVDRKQHFTKKKETKKSEDPLETSSLGVIRETWPVSSAVCKVC